MRIRAAAATDAAAIVAIWNPVIRDPFITFTTIEKTEAGIAALIAERQAAGQTVIVAEADGVEGFATYGPFRAGPGYLRTMEHTILIAPEGRGRGVGRRLMAALEEHARAAGIHSLIGGISGANPAAIAFHAAAGFVEVGRIPDAGWKYGRYLDLVLMQKRF
ncbi:GNAT family N-acetyltransferase [Acuticoccus mangrovi]|uniref:N-acetyltransferase n=1 Tax=Acuticoccus mangrovi TaxID=2796142 RepID=A0A934MFR0_9HYPH|nr:GNAT family N-acetyltransferase [Acuticoccus mangrovi]MBJ3775195.1 N-acetyltransferase [Acuticoccus mangrovi]